MAGRARCATGPRPQADKESCHQKNFDVNDQFGTKFVHAEYTSKVFNRAHIVMEGQSATSHLVFKFRDDDSHNHQGTTIRPAHHEDIATGRPMIRKDVGGGRIRKVRHIIAFSHHGSVLYTDQSGSVMNTDQSLI
jgi:hypothetical protein